MKNPFKKKPKVEPKAEYRKPVLPKIVPASGYEYAGKMYLTVEEAVKAYRTSELDKLFPAQKLYGIAVSLNIAYSQSEITNRYEDLKKIFESRPETVGCGTSCIVFTGSCPVTGTWSSLV